MPARSEIIIIEPGSTISIGDMRISKGDDYKLTVTKPTGFNREDSTDVLQKGRSIGTNIWRRNLDGSLESVNIEIG